MEGKRFPLVWILLFGAMLTVPLSIFALTRPNNTIQFLPYVTNPLPAGQWEITSENSYTPRHENGFVSVGDRFYLLGGRGAKPTEIYSPNSNSWQTVGFPPQEIHHFQAVTYHNKIYVVGAYTGLFPFEDNVTTILIYDPATDSWQTGAAIPRARGSSGVVVYEDKIYVVGGVIGGHGPHATTVNWFDVYDLTTNQWETLPDAPNPRDHFNAAVIGTKLYAAGGRITGSDNFAQNVIQAVDVYDFETASWSVLPNGLPTPRGGSMTAVLNNELVVIGGEGFNQAWAETEAYNPDTLQWRQLGGLQQARHASQVINCNDNLYIAGGSGAQGGAPELLTLERFYMSSPQPCTP